MNFTLAQVTQETAFNAAPGTGALYLRIFIVLAVGFGAVFALMSAPPRMRKMVVAFVTFISGLFYVLVWLWPKAQGRVPDTLPNGTVEAVAFWLQDGVGRINNLASTLTAFLLGLGAFSLLRIHGGKVFKQQKDWAYSLVLLISMAVMVFVGYWAWWTEKFSPLAVGATKVDLNLRENWNTAIYARDFVFDGMLQKMDAAMFSVIAFYIISAAYRAFRIRSVEATILLCAALIMMLSLLAVVDVASNGFVDMIGGKDATSLVNNLRISEIAGFIEAAFQRPSIRAIDFGIGVGALAMGIRLWLSLDKGGASS